MKSKSLLLVFKILTLVLAHAVGERILFLIPVIAKSHKNVFEPLILGLHGRGHSITVLAPDSSSKYPTSIHQVTTMNHSIAASFLPDPFEQRGQLPWTKNFFSVQPMVKASEAVYQIPEFLEAINQPYDLVFINAFLNEAFDGVLYKIGAPFIMVSTLAPPPMITEFTGNYLPSSFVPNLLLNYGDRMTFVQRVINFLVTLSFELSWKNLFEAKLSAVSRAHFGPDYPDSNQIRANVSLLLMNSHFSLTHPRPNLPDGIEVGGMHCRPPRKLPKDLDSFVSGGKDGFILFSLGSIVQTNRMPKKYIKIFLKVFSKLKQRVLWKWEAENMVGIPSNVMLSKWLPQQDVLGHPNIRLFMTHGGLLSTQEAVYHGVPVLGIPMFGDQDMNINKVVNQGYGLSIEILDMTEEELESKIRRILSEKTFKDTATRLSQIFRDQESTPLERALYWSEYVMRHKGAPHLRSAARDLNYFQVHSWDVYGFLLGIGILILAVISIIIRKLVQIVFAFPQAKTKVVKQNKKSN